MDLERKRIKEGYYGAEASRERYMSRQELLITREKLKMQTELLNLIKKEILEIQIAEIILDNCGIRAFKNYIFYNHTNEIVFNWRGFDSDALTNEEIEEAKAKLEGKLPDGVTIKVKK
jgi:hypothetical protein